MASPISTLDAWNTRAATFYLVSTLFIITIFAPTASPRPPGADSDTAPQVSSDGASPTSPGPGQTASKLGDEITDPNAAQTRTEYSGQLAARDFDHPVFDFEDIPNEIPVNPGVHVDRTLEQDTAYELDRQSRPGPDPGRYQAPAAPKYMVELYNNYSASALPKTNIVRSYMNINEDTSVVVFPLFGNKTRVHTLVFNITSIAEEEDIYLAELRLYTLVEADRNQFHGQNRRVSVHELEHDPVLGNLTTSICTKEIYGHHSGWEVFEVTDAVRRWVQSGLTWNSQILEVRIDSFSGSEDQVDFDTRPHNENEPLLVVFSNDKRRRSLETRELHELGHLAHELAMYDILEEDEDNEIDEDYDEDYYSYYDLDDYLEIQKRDTSSVTRGDRVPRSVTPDSSRNQTFQAPYSQMLHFKVGDSDLNGELTVSTNRGQVDDSKHHKSKITKRSSKKKKRKRRRRRYCRRRPLYVNFQSINWHTWIIAPKGYQAYQCLGRCDFPLSDHLTPTKHAIIQTLVHANYGGARRKQRTGAACCVPTRLDPISILYIDDRGIVTYKYDYDDMVVAECGCR